MADKDFVVKNGLVVNTNVLVVNGSNVGINTTTPDAVFTVNGTANVAGNTSLAGQELEVTANATFFGNLHTKNSVYIDQTLYVGNTATMVQDLPTIMQAVDNFNGFVMISSQNLSQEDDACADLLIYADITNGLSNFNDLGINNSRFDGRIHRIIVNAAANSWSLGETVFQRNGAGANIAVGQIRDILSINSTAVSLKIRVSEDDGIPTYVGMPDFANTTGSNLSLRAVTSGANADVLHAVPFGSTAANTLSRRNYAFTVAKRGDGYLYNANSALTIGTTSGGIRSETISVSTSFSGSANVLTVRSGNTAQVKPDMEVTGTGIDTGTYVTSVVNSTAFKISKPTTGTGSGSISLRDEFYDLTEANNPIIFHVGGMMSKNEIARFSGTGNFTIGPNTTSRDAKLTVNGTANLAGQVNVGANLNVVGNINTSANVYAPRGIFSTSANVGNVSISTTAIDIGANVNIDPTGLRVTGNTLIPSMNISGGNITAGNDSISNTPTVRLVNSTSSANMTPGGMTAGIVVISANSSNGSVNVGSNVFMNATAISVGNTSSNVVLNMSEPDYKLKIQGGAYVNGNMVITTNLVVQGTMTYAGNTEANANFIPATNNAFDLGNTSYVWKTTYSRDVVVPTDGVITTGNSSLNATMRFDSLRVSNSSAFSNVSVNGLSLGNTTVNAQVSSSGLRIGNSTSNSVVTNISLAIGNSTVNAIVNSSSFSGNLFAVFANATTVNTTTLNGTIANVATVNASANVRVGANVTLNTGALIVANSSATSTLDGTSLNVGNSSVVSAPQIRVQNTTGATVINANFISTTSISGNLTGNVAATTISGNLTGNVAATTISGNLTGNVAATTISGNLTGNVIATVVNATTMNAARFQVGSAFSANSTDVFSPNLTVTGNLVVTGSLVSMNTVNMDVTDLNITVAKGVPTAGGADGAGITVDTANVSLVYSAASGNWLSNTGISVGNSSVNVTTNSSAFVGNVVATFANATTVNSTTVNATTVNASTLSIGSLFTANSTVVNAVSYNVGTRVVANSTVTNATHLNGQLASYYLDANNLTGALPYAVFPANIVNTTADFTRAGVTTFGANVVLGSSGLSANGGYGTSGQVLTSNGTATYWSSVSAGGGGTVTSVANGNGLTGGPITSTGTLSVTPGTGVVVNATGVHVNANYIATLTSNSSLFLGTFAASQYYRSGGADVSMQDGGTSSTLTATAGAVVYSNTVGMALTGVGTAGQVLTSNGSSAPYWSTTGAFETGTKILFQQTTAPTGWTKLLSHDNKALRIVSGTVGSGGTTGFTAAFASRTVSGTTGQTAADGTIGSTATTGTVGGTTLTASQMPAHQHSVVADFSGSDASPVVGAGQYVAQYNSTNSNATYGLKGTGTVATLGLTSAVGGGTSHTHSFTGSSHSHTFTGTGHTHTFSTSLDMSVAYVDAIIASKD